LAATLVYYGTGVSLSSNYKLILLVFFIEGDLLIYSLIEGRAFIGELDEVDLLKL
jgi:hypothetical protein